MTKTTEMRPCPFCGSDEVDVGEHMFNRRVKSVGCGECGAEGPCSTKKEEAIRMWNQRTGPEDPS